MRNVSGVMKRGIKLAAVSGIVVLALTGFSTGRGHGHSRGHSSGGGGCSSSSQDHDSSSNSSTSGGGSSGSTYGADDDVYGTSSGGSGYTRRPHHRSTPSPSATGNTKSPQNGTVRLIKCADATRPYATVQVSNPNSKSMRFDVHVAFLDVNGGTVEALFHEVQVPAKGKVTAKVPVGGDDLAAEVDRCDVDPDALVQV